MAIAIFRECIFLEWPKSWMFFTMNVLSNFLFCSLNVVNINVVACIVVHLFYIVCWNADMDRWSDYLKDLWVKSLLPVIIFFWIWIVTFLFLFKGIWGNGNEVSIFKIGYTSFALICIISFQFSRDFWQKMITRFWTFVIIYEVFVFVVILLFQIESVRSFCHNIGLNDQWKRDIGLELPNTSVSNFLFFLFRELLIILMVVILQILIFKTPPIPRIPFHSLNYMVEFLDSFFDITKLTVFGIIMTCISKVNAIHFCFLIAAVFSMILRRNIRYIIIQLISVCAAILLVSQMVMQMHFFTEPKNVTCYVPQPKRRNITLSNGEWLGFGKIHDTEPVLFNVIGYICIIALVTLYTIVIKERSLIQGLSLETSWDPVKMFSDPTYLKADVDFKSYFKYLLKYGFYRYGIEITLASIAMLIQARLDVWALLYSIWLVVFVVSSSRFLPMLWSIFKYFVLISIPLQYVAALGFWPEKCFGYVEEITNEKLVNACSWLQLPLGTMKPNASKMFWDSLVFLLMLCQAQVFDFEKEHGKTTVKITSPKIRALLVQRPITTFGLAKFALFYSLPIVCSIMFFLAATIHISLFSIGYGFGFVMILWFADYYFLRPVHQTQEFWKYLLMLNVLIILFKTALQIPACIFAGYLETNACWLVQLFSIACLKEINTTITFFQVPLINTPNADEKHRGSCWYVGATAGIEFDVLSFIVLMFHKRFLLTNYFLAMSREAALDLKFSSRAAKILEELNKQEVVEIHEKYKRSLAKIHKKMARLKEIQKKIRGLKMTEPLTHQEVVTSGDYYMFDDAGTDSKFDHTEEDMDKSVIKVDDCQSTPSTPNIGKLMEAVMKTDIEQALKMADSGSLTSDKSIKSPSTRQDEETEVEQCHDCYCEKRPEMDSTTKKPPELSKTEKKINVKTGKKYSKTPLPTVILVKDEKLLPTVNFDRRKSVAKTTTTLPTKRPKPKTTREPSKPSKGGKHVCDCKTCKCHIRCRFKFLGKVCLTIRFILAFINSCMISLCQLFNEIAYDYKYIKKQLQKEKYAARKSIISSSLIDSDFIGYLDFSYFAQHKKQKNIAHLCALFVLFSSVAFPANQTNQRIMNFLKKYLTTVDADKSKPQIVYQVPIIIRLFISFYEVIMSSFNTVCYLAVLLLQMKNPTILTIPLSLMIFLWGSLSVPRPTKGFWKFILAYTGALLILECIARIPVFELEFPETQKVILNDSYYNYNKDNTFSVYYLLVMLCIFLQRRILMNIGLWRDDPMEPRGGNIFRSMYDSVKNFYSKLIHEQHQRTPVDVYTGIFLCEFINIFIFIFGFAALNEKQEDGVTKYFSENKIPPTMLIILILHCACIFIDRWIYLRRHVLAKLIFHVSQILVLHLCLFLFLPKVRKVNDTVFPIIWYWLKSAYFLLSAYQIRRGYPAYVHGHVLCQSYSVVNMYLYQFYLLFPFVYELRTVTDWMWTETTLTLTEWLGMEDIFCTVFQLKCWRNYDNKYSYKRGQKITSTVKFSVGGGIVLLFFLMLLFPLIFFTFGRAVGKTNLPTEMDLKFRIASHAPIFHSYSSSIRGLSFDQWNALKEMYAKSDLAKSILSEYYNDDIGIVQFSRFSQEPWTLSKSVDDLIKELKSTAPLPFVTYWELSREPENLKQSDKVTGTHSTLVDSNTRNILLQILNGTNITSAEVTCSRVLPKFLKVTSLTTAHSIDTLMSKDDHSSSIASAPDSITGFVDVNFTIVKDSETSATHYYPTDEAVPKLVDKLILGEQDDRPLVIYTFNEKIFSTGLLSYFSAQGILGLYTTFLISVGFIIRRLCRGRTNQVFLDYIPNVDAILQLLLDIYFVREHKDGKLEEDLYAKLIFLFRSPETLIRWTRLPDESD